MNENCPMNENWPNLVTLAASSLGGLQIGLEFQTSPKRNVFGFFRPFKIHRRPISEAAAKYKQFRLIGLKIVTG
jgi:hypothetical protein